MRLQELLKEYKIDKQEEYGDIVPNFQDAPPPEAGMSSLGKGYYSTAWEVDDRPEDVVKGSRPLYSRSEKDVQSLGHLEDGYFIFLNFLVKNEDIADNPYFPHIRKFKVYQTNDPKKPFSYTAEIERLYSVETVTKKEIGHIYRVAAGSEENYEALKKEIFTEFAHINHKDDMFLFLQALLVVAQRGKIYHLLGDKNLREAIAYIRQLADTEKYNIDLHAGNIMLRRGTVGTQLVIVDPLGMPNDYL